MDLSFKVKFFNFFRRIFQFPPLERRLANLTRGKLPDDLICKLVPNPYQYESPAFRDMVVDGIRLRVDISDYIGHYCYFGFLDPAHRNLFFLCEDHYDVLDIGANIGFTVLKFASRVPKGTVKGFEPDLFNFSSCSHNLSLNRFTNATVLNIGLGAKSEELCLEVKSPRNRGGNRISPHGIEGDRVRIEPLDVIFPTLGLSKINLVKIDVEGYELHVLRGAKITLKRYKPILFVEVDDDHLLDQGESAAKLIDFIHELGYGSMVDAATLKPIARQSDFRHCHFDVIAR